MRLSRRELNILRREVAAGEFEEALALCEAGMPLQYVLGRWEFMSLEFFIGREVLIPRPDTETLVETILAHERKGSKGLEIGVGSGCISISLAHHGGIIMLGTDICPRAVEIAKFNATRHSRESGNPPTFVAANLFPPGIEEFDFIVSNPPYIPTGEIADLDESVKNYEPLSALDGGHDGLEFYRRIAAQAAARLAVGGRIYFEIGYNQGEDVKNILKMNGFFGINIIKDLAGHDRVIVGVKND
jgi:release factor glutamine methyltransferase